MVFSNTFLHIELALKVFSFPNQVVHDLTTIYETLLNYYSRQHYQFKVQKSKIENQDHLLLG